MDDINATSRSCVGGKKVFSSKLITVYALTTATLVKLWLTGGQHLMATSFEASKFDASVFISMADNLMRGMWLGKYGELTLAKGPFYSIYIALNSFLHIPLLFSQQLLYIVACLLFLFSIQPFIIAYKSRGVIDGKEKSADFYRAFVNIVLGAVLIFNPITSVGASVVREGIYSTLTLLVVSSFIALLSYRKISLQKYISMCLVCGILLAAFWLTREEGIWVVPFTVFTTLYILVLSFFERKKDNHWFIRPLLSTIPYLVLWFSILAISIVNGYIYGVNSVVEYKSPEFVGAYSSLARVRSDRWLPHIPVSKRTREKIYQVSPAFKELQPYLEGVRGDWANSTTELVYPQYKGEAAGGWFMWAFRGAVADAGYYSSGSKAMGFYTRLEKEINVACDQGKLSCVKSTKSMYPKLDGRYLESFYKTYYNSAIYLVSFQDYTPGASSVVVRDAFVNLTSDITRQPITDSYSHKAVRIMSRIGDIYKMVFPTLTVLALIVYLGLLTSLRSINDPLYVITGAMGMLVAVRIFLVSLIDVTSFPATNIGYLCPVYPLFIVFDLLAFILLYRWFVTRKKV